MSQVMEPIKTFSWENSTTNQFRINNVPQGDLGEKYDPARITYVGETPEWICLVDKHTGVVTKMYYKHYM